MTSEQTTDHEPSVAVVAVEADLDERLRAVGRQVIVSPAVGARSGGYTLSIQGRALAKRLEPVAVRVTAGGRALQEVALGARAKRTAERALSLTKRAPFRFRFAFSTLALPPSFTVRVDALTADGHGLSLATLSGCRSRLPPIGRDGLQPILLTSLGRSGTTFTMGLLGRHPQVAMHERFPYETRCAQYWMQSLLIHTAPARRDSTFAPGAFLEDLGNTGPNPAYDPSILAPYVDGPDVGTWFAEEAHRFSWMAVANVEDFYRRIAAHDGRTGATHFIEKMPHPGHLYWPFHDLYPGLGTVALVRDPRDMLCSMLAFNAKRGRLAFGREQVSSDEDFVWKVVQRIEEGLSVLDQDGVTATLVRYEDLVTDTRGTLARIFDETGLDDSAAVVEEVVRLGTAETDKNREHQTSAGVAASIGRWQRDLPRNLRPVCERAFEPLLARLGYDG